MTVQPLQSKPGMSVTQYLASIHEDQITLLMQRNNPKEIMQYSIALNLALNAEAGKEEGDEVSDIIEIVYWICVPQYP